MPKAIDLTGRQFGRLTVQFLETHEKGRARHWHCQCDCGHECSPSSENLLSGNSKSCGFCRAATAGSFKPKHGDIHSPAYMSWASMRQRVNGTQSGKYRLKTYGGLSVCSEWDDYLVFKADMGERPAGTTLDRKDNFKGYFKENCRWATPTEQTRNRRITKRYTIDGVEKTVMEWAETYGISFGAAQYRLRSYGAVDGVLSRKPPKWT